MRAIGYIRQSRRADLDVALSYDVQLAAIKRMAAGDGIEDVSILSDMGRSGAAGKERLRGAYQELLATIADGEVTHVYSLSMSRVARSLTELSRFYALCADRGIRVRFEKEGEIRFDTPDGKLRANIIGSVYEFERDIAVERARDNAKVRRARGERMGRTPYGERPGDQPDKVIGLYRDTSSLTATARLLNEQGVPSWSGREWNSRSVRLFLERQAPHLLPVVAAKGAKPSGGFIFYRLLRCPHDEKLLTGSRDGSGVRDVVYRCHDANERPAHPRPYRVRESLILPWFVEQWDAEFRRRTPPTISLGESDEDAREALEARRRQVLDMEERRLLRAGEAESRLAAIEDEMAALDRITRIVAVPDLDWDWAPRDLNATLRLAIDYIEIDAGFRPLRIEWGIPLRQA